MHGSRYHAWVLRPFIRNQSHGFLMLINLHSFKEGCMYNIFCFPLLAANHYWTAAYVMPNDDVTKSPQEHRDCETMLIWPQLELDRLDLFHQMVKIIMLGQLHFCPLPKDTPVRILDVGTGTGIWAIEMGEWSLPHSLFLQEGPSKRSLKQTADKTRRWVPQCWSSWHWSQSHANQLVRSESRKFAVKHTRLTLSRVPTNVKFEVDDCEAEWAFQHKFDLIHLRYMAASLKSWPKMVRQCYENTVPGGWTELQDFDLLYRAEDGSLPEDAPLNFWIRTLMDASRAFGNDPCPGENLGQWLVDAGFEDVHVDKFPIPIGPWPKDKHLVWPHLFPPAAHLLPWDIPENRSLSRGMSLINKISRYPLDPANALWTFLQKTIGAWNLVEIEDGLEAFTLRLYTQQLGWKPQEVQVLLAKVRKDLRNPRIHALFYLWVFDSPYSQCFLIHGGSFPNMNLGL